MNLHSGSLGSDHRVRFMHLTTSSEIIAASCPRYAVASSVKAPPGCSVWSFLGGLEQKVRLLRSAPAWTAWSSNYLSVCAAGSSMTDSPWIALTLVGPVTLATSHSHSCPGARALPSRQVRRA